MARRRVCYACGSRSGETAFPAWRAWSISQDDLCADCLLEWPAEQARSDRCTALLNNPLRRKITTRASYRAQVRARRASGQGDLVDLVVPAP
jgi:hypothetical protein